MSSETQDGPDIAIVGMAGRFPDAPDVASFWRNLREGHCAIRPLSDAELDALGVPEGDRSHADYVRAAAPLGGVEEFDAAFFGYSPREAELMDPQQRIFLECAWEAFENAGYDPEGIDGSVGVFAGATTSMYLLLNLASRPELASGGGGLQLFVGNTGDSLATRVSYELNLRGPSFAVQSACSTSLLAVHLACQSLLNHECDVALAGGVSVNLAARGGYRYVEGSILSPDGTCHPFDANARGTVFGSGAGAVVLKRLSRAIEDGDRIRAVIRGSAVSNDGRLKAGFAAPGVEGQSAAITEALAASGLSGDDLSYVESHGTGTHLGDPIEIQALTRAFRASTPRKGFCALGSLKGSIGHLDVAAGVAGLIKTVLSLENQFIPPSVGFAEPNPLIDFSSSPVYVNRAGAPWRTGRTPRRAGVSSFGLGGTNVHAVLEEAPARATRASTNGPQLLVLSARTPEALDAATARLSRHLGEQLDADLSDVAFTLQAGRHPFRFRRAVVASDARGAVAALGSCTAIAEADDTAAPPIAFLFPGHGHLRPGAGAELYRAHPEFRAELDRCAEELVPLVGTDLRKLLFADPDATAESLSGRTELALPALFALEYSLAKTWMERGVRPDAMLGHSFGEYVAACLAGVFTLPDALALVAARSRLMQGLPPGAMLAVEVAPGRLDAVLPAGHGLSVAIVNEKERCVVSGSERDVEAAAVRLEAGGIPVRRLDLTRAFHSPAMDPILDEFRASVVRAHPREPQLRFVSNVTGTWILPEEATDPDYWTRHLRQTVRFADGLATLAEGGHALLEVGPGQSLASIARRSGARVVASSMPGKQGPATEPEALLDALGQLWGAGIQPDWASLHGSARPRRVPLPTYPFERRRYWIAPRARNGAQADPSQEEAPVAQVLHPRPELKQAWVEPRSDLERRVAAVWQELLGIGSIGVDDNFFAVGGDSLLATQVASRLRSQLGVEVSLRPLLRNPTIASMASLIVTTLSERIDQELLQGLLSEVRRLTPDELEAALSARELRATSAP